jgi:hypothetical protein
MWPETIWASLPNKKIYALLSGIKGIGKTEIAKNFFFSNAFNLSIWVDADAKEKSFEKIMKDLALCVNEERMNSYDNVALESEDAFFEYLGRNGIEGSRALKDTNLSVLVVVDGMRAPAKAFCKDGVRHRFNKLFILDTTQNSELADPPLEWYLSEWQVSMLTKEKGGELLGRTHLDRDQSN